MGETTPKSLDQFDRETLLALMQFDGRIGVVLDDGTVAFVDASAEVSASVAVALRDAGLIEPVAPNLNPPFDSDPESTHGPLWQITEAGRALVKDAQRLLINAPELRPMKDAPRPYEDEYRVHILAYVNYFKRLRYLVIHWSDIYCAWGFNVDGLFREVSDADCLGWLPLPAPPQGRVE